MPKNVLIGCTGSVASIKIPEILKSLHESNGNLNIALIPTQHALHFVNVDKLSGITVHKDEDEWNKWEKRGDPVLHIELRRWADVLLIAPLDANTLAKISGGICDNLLTCVVRAWDLTKPLLFAPAMNTYMWEHPITAKQIQELCDLGYKEIPCVEKTLICGDKGMGAMASVEDIVRATLAALTDE